MKNLNKLKILIVGMTTVLGLLNYDSQNWRKGIVRFHYSAENSVVCQNDFSS